MIRKNCSRNILLFYLGLISQPAFGNDGWIDGRLKQLSLAEKIGQMLMVDFEGQRIDPLLSEHLDEGYYGNLILFDRNIQSFEQVKLLTSQAQERAIMRSGIPMIIAVDQEGGRVNRIGKLINSKTSRIEAHTIGQAFKLQSNRVKKALNSFNHNLAQDMKFMGINMNLAPVLDTTYDPRSFIFRRSYSGNTQIVTKIAHDISRAMQTQGIMVTGKHFPNLSNTRIDSHRALPTLKRSLNEMQRYEFLPFKNLRNTLDAIMLGHIIVPSIDPSLPASISPKVTSLLRQQVGFKGVIITDDLKMGALTEHYTFEEIILKSLQADSDILLVAWGRKQQKVAFDTIYRAVKDGRVPIERIDRSLRRILELKRRYLFEANEDHDLVADNLLLQIYQ